MNLRLPDAATLAEAATALQRGELVAFPTETVYGLGADATNDQAVARIYAAKGRPSFNPLIVHVPTLDEVARLGVLTPAAEELAVAFWPGPLTLVLNKQQTSGLSPLASAGLPSVAIRVPSHPVAQALLKAAGIPIAAPSANKSGRLSPTTPKHVADQFGDEIAMILAGGRTEVGLESTVLDLTEAQPVLLRHGGITREEIEALIGPVALVEKPDMLKSPGLLPKHYAPSIPLRMDSFDAGPEEAYLAFGPDTFAGKGAKTRLNLSEDGDLTEAAANLFSMLHELDRPDYAAIVVAPVPMMGLGLAINDRLRRAVTHS
jgi:L-threonylcarbamoyladenylate synthase